jgi:hypothetical protein
MEGQIHKKKENTFLWLFVSPWQRCRAHLYSWTSVYVSLCYPRETLTESALHTHQKNDIWPLLFLLEPWQRKDSHTQLEEDIGYLVYINPREIRTELEAHLTTGEGYLTSAISRDTWGRAERALITLKYCRLSRIFGVPELLLIVLLLIPRLLINLVARRLSKVTSSSIAGFLLMEKNINYHSPGYLTSDSVQTLWQSLRLISNLEDEN